MVQDYIWSKKALEDLHKDKVNFPPSDNFTIQYKEILRDLKNSNESRLKHNRRELEIERGTIGYESPKFITNPEFSYEEKVINKFIERFDDDYSKNLKIASGIIKSLKDIIN